MPDLHSPQCKSAAQVLDSHDSARNNRGGCAKVGAPMHEDEPLTYKPEPVATSEVRLAGDILELTEVLAKNAHDVWAKQRLADGWTYGPQRDDANKKHPCLVPYEQLPESEKEYDRKAAMETVKAIIALGYRISRAS